uniref:Uncharacterized protein n=1 Tax=Rhizophora mucronata TaxID=61149 RepID=A0A2P2KFQ6_RHIMU
MIKISTNGMKPSNLHNSLISKNKNARNYRVI